MLGFSHFYRLNTLILGQFPCFSGIFHIKPLDRPIFLNYPENLHPAKLRYIDPLVAGLGRVSRLDAGVRQAQEAFLATDFACWIGVPEETAGEND